MAKVRSVVGFVREMTALVGTESTAMFLSNAVFIAFFIGCAIWIFFAF